MQLNVHWSQSTWKPRSGQEGCCLSTLAFCSPFALIIIFAASFFSRRSCLSCVDVACLKCSDQLQFPQSWSAFSFQDLYTLKVEFWWVYGEFCWFAVSSCQFLLCKSMQSSLFLRRAPKQRVLSFYSILFLCQTQIETRLLPQPVNEMAKLFQVFFKCRLHQNFKLYSVFPLIASCWDVRSSSARLYKLMSLLKSQQNLHKRMPNWSLDGAIST